MRISLALIHLAFCVSTTEVTMNQWIEFSPLPHFIRSSLTLDRLTICKASVVEEDENPSSLSGEFEEYFLKKSLSFVPTQRVGGKSIPKKSICFRTPDS